MSTSLVSRDASTLEHLLTRLEAQSGAGSASCVTFGLPSARFAEGSSILREEKASATKIRSCL